MLTAGSASRAISAFARGSKALRPRILVVEEDKGTRGILCDYLEDKGYEIALATNCALAEQLWRTAHPDIAILDYSLSDGNALALIPRLKAIDASIPVIILTGYGSIDFAVEAVKLGAELFLPKPAELSTLHILIQRSLENQRKLRRLSAEDNGASQQETDPFLGKSDSIKRLADLAHKVALNDTPALIRGETGTGKRTLARWLHRNGPRASEPFVDLLCSERRGNLLEEDLFGRDHDALGEVLPSRVALIEIAHKGTVFLDEIGNVALHVQPKLVRVVEDKQFQRLGEVFDRRVDIRLIAATQQAVASAAFRKQFRGDLYDRISWISLSVPPLRERAEDIPILGAHILGELAADLGTGTLELSGVALRALQGYSWPGNVRELRNVLERVVLVAGKDASADQDFRFDAQIEQYLSGIGHFKTLEEMERNYIQQVLRKERGRVQLAARKLGIPRSSLYHKLKQYRMEQPGLLSVS